MIYDTYSPVKGYNADSLFMEMTGRGKNQKILNAPTLMNSTRINSTTISTLFNPTDVGHFDIR